MGVDGRGLSTGVGRCVETGERIGLWTAERLGAVFDARAAEAIGLVCGERIEAGVIYENWNGASIMAHIVAEASLNRAFLRAIFHYPFEVCGVGKVICPVATTNIASARLAEHMGFTAEARLADCAPGGDVILYTLAKSACRFLGGRYGKENA
jgi:RimJ/RimL family protein N-acetyltransferase